jgi:hypothetical protein
VIAAARHDDSRSDRASEAGGKSIQDDYDHGVSWDELADTYKITKSAARRLTREYREEADRKAHENQLTMQM